MRTKAKPIRRLHPDNQKEGLTTSAQVKVIYKSQPMLSEDSQPNTQKFVPHAQHMSSNSQFTMWATEQMQQPPSDDQLNPFEGHQGSMIYTQRTPAERAPMKMDSQGNLLLAQILSTPKKTVAPKWELRDIDTQIGNGKASYPQTLRELMISKGHANGLVSQPNEETENSQNKFSSQAQTESSLGSQSEFMSQSQAESSYSEFGSQVPIESSLGILGGFMSQPSEMDIENSQGAFFSQIKE